MNEIVTNLKGVEGLIRFSLDTLGIDGVYLTVVRNDAFLDHLSPPDIELNALLAPVAVQECYNLYIKGGRPSSEVIFHEMVHLKQMVSGRLALSPKHDYAIWEGKRYDNSVRYFDRPWEKEAFIKQNELLKLYRKSKKK